MLRSAKVVTAVMVGGLVLLVPFGSVVGELTLAMLVSVPLAGAIKVKIRLLTAPIPSVPRFQFTTPALFTPLPLAETIIAPTGKGSVSTTLLAAEGPEFVTEIV